MTASEPEDTLPSAAAQVKRLIRISRTGALATLGRETGAPLTTWVGFASDFNGAPLFLFSQIAQHTKNLALDARGSLLLTSPPDRGDPLNQPRVTLGGAISP
ncbi:MAG: pyridoxamine 5'-phosphate oxidase family protein, partial [Roseiarcus sp.]